MRKIGMLALLVFLAQFASGSGQYREYNVSGIVVDTQENPLPKVEILLREIRTSRSYSLKTKKNGTFRFVGLPHGIYKVVFKKEGFAEKEDEWKFEERQEKMKRVEIPPVVLVSQEILNEAQRLKQAAAEVQAAAEKIRQGEYDTALTDLRAILEKSPEDPNALYLLGMAYLKKNMWAEAAESFLRVNELAPMFPAAYYQLGVCYQQLEEQDKALDSYRKAMELDPANPDSPYNAGLILFAESSVDEALELFEKALSLRPDDPAALEMIGRCHIHKGDFPKAVDLLEKAKAGYASDQEKAKFLNNLIIKLKEQIKK
jgi:tetratricopeptide (TPR) repeat protein